MAEVCGPSLCAHNRIPAGCRQPACPDGRAAGNHKTHSQPVSTITRVATYARAKTMKRKSIEDPAAEKRGLTRIHSGMESGSAEVLELIQKGNTRVTSCPADCTSSLQKFRFPNTSCRGWRTPAKRAHAVETAKILNQIRPDFIRVRTLAVHPLSPLQRMVDEGTFEP